VLPVHLVLQQHLVHQHLPYHQFLQR
jgi:hypothetical protein